MALFSVTPLPFTSNLAIINDPDLGRCFSSLQVYRTGEVLFTESALVWASYSEEERLDKRVRKLYEKAYPKAAVKNIVELLDELSRLESVQSIDTARSFLQLVALSVLRSKNEIAAISEFASVADDNEISLKMHFLDSLTASNLDRCIADVVLFRKAYPKVIPKSVTDEQAGHLLGVLNTNQLELEELGGSGLFVGTAVTEHSCYPNCSFTTNGHMLYMTAIREIAIGERISIDYGNNFYHPTGDRIESLEESYRFICKCSMCVGPDVKRAFNCNNCFNGTVYPIGTCLNIESDNSFTQCQSCGQSPSLSYRQICLSKEEQYRNEPLSTLDEIRHVCGVEKIIHESHHLIFWASDDLAMLLAARARSNSGPTESNSNSKVLKNSDAVIHSRQCYRDALTAMGETVRLLEIMLPPVHHEKVMYYDRLGQLAVAAGELDFAGVNFMKAYQMSCLACGVLTPCTLQIQKLIINPPKNLSELLHHYQQTGGKNIMDTDDN